MPKTQTKSTASKQRKPAKIKNKLNFTMMFETLLTFGLAQIIGVLTAVAILAQNQFTPVQLHVPWYYLIVSFFVVTSLIILAIRFLKGGKFFIAVFYFVVVLGSYVVFSTFMDLEFALVAALLILVFRLTIKQIWIHNLAIVLGLAGISASVGMDIKPLGIIILLIGLSIYDYIAVYRTKTMVKMFKGLLARGVIFSIIIPEHIKNWAVDLGKVKKTENFMFLGTGDIALPIIFAASALSTDLKAAFGVVIGAMVGVILIHVFFRLQKKKAAMPALPPIAFCSIIGYLITLYL